jgi:hypothetical protein
VVPSLSALLLCGVAIAGLLGSAREVLRGQGPLRIGVAGIGASVVFLVVAIGLLIWSYSMVDPDRMR